MTAIIAHRGSKGTKPENTLPAFLEAVQLDVDGIELDVQLTKDNQVVVIHDETVDRTTDGTGFIKDMTFDHVQQLDAGSWFSKEYANEKIPLLRNVLQVLVKHQFSGFLNIEFKTDKLEYEGIEQLVLAELKDLNYHFPIIFSSFNQRTVKRLNSMSITESIAFISYGSLSEQGYLANNDLWINGYHPKFSWLKDHIHLFKETTLHIRPWTVNEEEDMIWCFDHGLSGFFTDFPKKAIEVRKIWKNKK